MPQREVCRQPASCTPRQLWWRRRSGEGSEPLCRGLGPPREMIEDFLDHHWIFDARDAVQGCTNAARAGCAGAAAFTALLQCSQVKMSILTKSPGAIRNSRRAQGGGRRAEGRGQRAEGRMPGVIPVSNVAPMSSRRGAQARAHRWSVPCVGHAGPASLVHAIGGSAQRPRGNA